MRSRYVYSPQGELIYAIERGVVTVDKREVNDPGYMVMPDIQPYQSMADGSMIKSRSEHREHLKQHGLIEIGNEKLTPRANLTGQKDAVVRAVQQAKEQYGSRYVERAISDSLQRAHEMNRHRR